MRSGRPSILIATLVLGFALSAARPVLAAEVIYKSISPSGEISYSRRPEPGALRVETIKIEALTPEQRRAIARFELGEAKAGRDANVYAAGLDAKWTRVDDEIKQAQAQLQRAEGALQAGREPMPGERLGIRGGGSRLTLAYFARLSNLELEVEQARQRLDRAYGARNDLK